MRENSLAGIEVRMVVVLVGEGPGNPLGVRAEYLPFINVYVAIRIYVSKTKLHCPLRTSLLTGNFLFLKFLKIFIYVH